MEIQARLLEDKFYLLFEYFQAKEHYYLASMTFFVDNCKVQCGVHLWSALFKKEVVLLGVLQ